MKTGTINLWTPSAATIYEHVVKEYVSTDVRMCKFKVRRLWLGLKPTVDIMRPLCIECDRAYERFTELEEKTEEFLELLYRSVRKWPKLYFVGKMSCAVAKYHSSVETLSEAQLLAAEHMPETLDEFKEITSRIDFRSDCVSAVSAELAEVYYNAHECKTYVARTDLKNIDTAMKNVLVIP